MRAAFALLALSLGGCILYDPQPQPDPGCADPGNGCDVPPDAGNVPAQPLANGGTLTLTQTVQSTGGACEVDPTNPVVLAISPQLVVTADAPKEILQSDVEFLANETTTVSVALNDNWGETWFVQYDLTAHTSHEVFGDATASSPGCSATLHVEGTWTE